MIDKNGGVTSRKIRIRHSAQYTSVCPQNIHWKSRKLNTMALKFEIAPSGYRTAAGA
jgi:hypothetical protein